MKVQVRVRVGDFEVESYFQFSWGSLTDFLVDL
jgi:hypothetical protein